MSSWAASRLALTVAGLVTLGGGDDPSTTRVATATASMAASSSLALASACATSLCGSLQDHGDCRGEETELKLVATPGGLASNYRLSVTDELPDPPQAQPPPASLLEAAALSVRPPAAGAGCPFDVRAIVEGDIASEAFAVLAVGDESKLVHAGDKFQRSGTRISIVTIDSRAVLARLGDNLVRCNFKFR